jgi:hypothetical protein
MKLSRQGNDILNRILPFRFSRILERKILYGLYQSPSECRRF